MFGYGGWLKTMKAYIKQLRPDHWLKNIFVFVPLVFSLELIDPEKIWESILAFISFCFVSSSVYTFNDILDAHKDAIHPVKCSRPIASGLITKPKAWIMCVLLLICGEGISCTISMATWISLSLYIVINIWYTLKLKHISIIDCFCIAAGFVLRVYVGAIATETAVSDWLFLTIIAMSLFMGFGKRHGEMLKINGSITRKVLMQYDLVFLKGMMFTCAGLTIVFYSLWAMTRQLDMIYTVPMVIFVVCRYLLDVCGNDSHGDPTTVIFKDRVLLISCGTYVLLTIGLLYRNMMGGK